MTKTSTPDLLDGIEKASQKAKEKFIQILHLLKSLAFTLIGYSFLSWIFLSIYDAWGFEKTLIILLIGVFYYGLRGIISMEVIRYAKR